MRAGSAFASRTRVAAVVLLALSGAAALAVRAGAAVRLEYRGSVLTRAQVDAQMQRALRTRAAGVTGGAAAAQAQAGPDSAAVAAGLAGLVERLQNLGFLNARASASWDSASTPGGDARMIVRVIEGPRVRFREVRVANAPAADSARFAATLGLTPGSWASPRAAAEAIERALRDAVEHGHPYAELGVRGWTQEADGVTLTLNGRLGPLVTVNGARIEGLHVTREAVARKSMGRLSGLPYNRSAAEAAREIGRASCRERV